ANASRWHEECHMRISSTTANAICTRGGNFDALALGMCRPKRFTYKAVQYGIETEPTARKELQGKLTDIYSLLFQTGLVVLPEQPWLCCSPDGLIQVSGETILIEIKCPESCKTRPIFDREAGVCNVAFLTNTDGELSLEPLHPHYTQVQVQLYVLNLKKAIFYVYSPKASESVLVKRDERFNMEKIPKYEYFYFTRFFPIIFK
ncbi:unnamed protein product, partial [Ixodes persulcatus]